MDEAAPGAAVAVTEGVDGLELGVRDRSLRDGRKVVEVHERDEVIEQARHALGRGRDERGVVWARASPADPVLVRAHDSCKALLGRAFEQRAVDVEHVVESERAVRRADLDRALHRADVAEHGSCRWVGRDGLVRGERQPLVGRAQALDERGSEGLRVEQRGGDRLEVVAGTLGLELAQCGGRSGDGLRGATGERLVPVRDRVGYERLEAERLAVTASAVAATFPETVDELGQRSDPSRAEMLRKERVRSFRYGSVPKDAVLRKETPRSFRSGAR